MSTSLLVYELKTKVEKQSWIS